MILYRALNEYDLTCNPLVNGVASKYLLYYLTEFYLSKKDIGYNFSPESERGKIVENSINDYLIKNYSKLKKKFLMYYEFARVDIAQFLKFPDFCINLSDQEIKNLVKNDYEMVDGYVMSRLYLSTLLSHLSAGSRSFTEWVSTSLDLGSISKYYDKQSIHKIAVISSDTNGLYTSDPNFCIDLSSYDKIDSNLKYISKQIKYDGSDEEYCRWIDSFNYKNVRDFDGQIEATDLSTVSFKYSIASKEVCFFRYIPSKDILNILEALQYDLFNIGRLNDSNIYNLNGKSAYELDELKGNMTSLLRNDPSLLHFFEELYLKNKNINSLVNEEESLDYISNCRDKILRLALDVPSGVIKKY